MNSANQHLSEDDLALFALALMPPQEAAYAKAHLKHCDLCRGEVARMQGDLVGYALTADMQDPPAAARSRLLDAVAQEKQMHVAEPAPAAEPVLAPRSTTLLDRPSGRNAAREDRFERTGSRGLGLFGWLGWAVAAAAIAVAGWQFHEGTDLHRQLAQQTSVTQQTAAMAEQNANQAQRNAQKAQDATATAQQNAQAARNATAAAQQNAEQARNATAEAQQNAQQAQNATAAAQQSEQQARQATAQARVTEAEAARARRVLQLLTDPAAMQVALRLTPAGKTPPKPEGHASYNPSRGELVFVASHLNPLQAGKTYELWILPASGAAPVAAGLFRPDARGNASVVLPNIPANVAAKGFGVTQENAGGSPTPTMPILLMGT